MTVYYDIVVSGAWKNAEEALAAAVSLGVPAKVRACPGCEAAECESIYPTHEGSPYCSSGSIASGGSRAHCTCDRCF